MVDSLATAPEQTSTSSVHSSRASARRPSLMGPALIALSILAGLLGGATILGGKLDPGKSGVAPSGTVNTDKPHEIRMPEGYPNLATKCSGVPKQRIWITTGADQATITTDARC